jgi:hypothetical protein
MKLLSGLYKDGSKLGYSPILIAKVMARSLATGVFSSILPYMTFDA